jgi:transcriptional regulator with XRE-family HTH domain
MQRVMRERARLELERRVRLYRRARLHPRPPEGWLRAMRLAVGIPAKEIADQMGFSAKMVFQLERQEQKRSITLERLERMARALGCDLVYGLVPWERSLEDRAMELVEREMWRKRYTARKQGAGFRAAEPPASSL